MNEVRVVAAGDAVLVAEFEDRIDPAVNARAVALAVALRAAALPGVLDVVPTFRSVAVYFDPMVAHVGAVRHAIDTHARTPAVVEFRSTPSIELPVCYDEEFGADLVDVARFASMTIDEVVATHTTGTYRVFMLGFVPGFAYLGMVDPRIAAPRRATPRTRVPAGSVGIAGAQTGIYPSTTPGGWNLIGRTPTRMLSFERAEPSLLQPGDTVRFRAIGRNEFDQLAAEAAQP